MRLGRTFWGHSVSWEQRSRAGTGPEPRGTARVCGQRPGTHSRRTLRPAAPSPSARSLFGPACVCSSPRLSPLTFLGNKTCQESGTGHFSFRLSPPRSHGVNILIFQRHRRESFGNLGEKKAGQDGGSLTGPSNTGSRPRLS